MGEVSWSGPFQSAFLFDQVAITIQHWFESASDGDECGVRVEIQRMVDSVASHGATEFAAKVLHIAGPIWRADIFTLSSGTQHNWNRAHYHSHFNGDEPCDRDWDAALTQDPFTWLVRKLREIGNVFELAGAADLVEGSDCARIGERSAQIVAAAELMMEEVWSAVPNYLPTS